MRNPERINKLLDLVKKIWFKNPDLRLLQLLIDALPIENRDPYYIEDDLLVDFLEDFYNKNLIRSYCRHNSFKLIENSIFQCRDCGEIIAEAKIAKMFDITPQK